MKTFRECINIADWEIVKKAFFEKYLQNVLDFTSMGDIRSLNAYLDEIRKKIIGSDTVDQDAYNSVVMITTREYLNGSVVPVLRPYKKIDLIADRIEARPFDITADNINCVPSYSVWDSELFNESIEKLLGGVIFELYKVQTSLIGMQAKAYPNFDETLDFVLDCNEEDMISEIHDLEHEYMEYCRRRELILFIVNNSKFLIS